MADQRRDGRRRLARAGRRLIETAVSVVLALAFAMALSFAWIVASGQTIRVPGWLAERAEARLDQLLDPAAIELGGLSLSAEAAVPVLRADDLSVTDGEGRAVATLPRAIIRLEPGAALTGRFAPRRVTIPGARITLNRRKDGRIALALGDQAAPISTVDGVSGILDRIETAFARPPLAKVESLAAEDVTLSYRDARAGREWRAEGGLLTVTRSEDEIAAQLFATLRGEGERPAEIALSASSATDSDAAGLSLSFSDVPARDIAAQSPALGALRVLEARISGSLRTGVEADGTLAPLAAALEIGSGALRPDDRAAPIAFNSAHAYLTYDPEKRRISLDEVRVAGPHVALDASGQVLVREIEAGIPNALVFQLALGETRLAPSGMFADPVRFSGGSADFKLSLAPFSLRLGQATLAAPSGEAPRLSGRVTVDEAGWTGALDFAADRLDTEQLLALWPVEMAGKARDWIARNVLAGRAGNLSGALRLRQGEAPVAGLSFTFAEARLRVLRHMPPAEGVTGRGTLSGKRFSVTATGGSIPAEGDRGRVSLAGTSFTVPDIHRRPAPADVTLAVEGPVPAALWLLDRRPFELMSKAGRSPDIASGRAAVSGAISLPLKKGVQPDEVSFSLTGTLSDVASRGLVPDRRLSAEELSLAADPGQLSISGRAALDGIPVTGQWRRPLGPETRDAPSRVEATVEITPEALETLDIPLPPGTLQGAGRGTLNMALPRGAPATFRLQSDLRGLGLSIPGAGWSKPPGAGGNFEIAGRLAGPVEIGELSLSAPGLTVRGGTISMTGSGALDAARFGNVQLGGWLDAPVTLSGRGPGQAPAIALRGGRVDLRERPPGGEDRGAGPGGPLTLSLDRLTISDGIAITGLSGRLRTGGALNGRLSGRVGSAPIELALSPAANGTRIDARSDRAGEVLKGAGIFPDAAGGRLTLSLVPRPEPGTYRGSAQINQVRVRDAPDLAQILNAISVVGLLDSLSGEGLFFSQAAGDFRLTPGAVEITRGRAIGPSLGISLNGTVALETGQLDLRGVVSPIYALNILGRPVSRPGEGLFGFNYSVTGTTDDPRVGVNPMSIILPGALRELFRAPRPSAPGQ